MLRVIRGLSGVCAVAAALSCGGSGSGGAAPDAGSGGSSGSGGSGGGVKHKATAKVSECLPGGEVKYTFGANTSQKLSVSASVPEGDAVTFEAVPDPQSVFRGWTGDCSGTSDCTLTVDAPKNLVAEFGPKATNAQAWDFTGGDSPASTFAPAVGAAGQVAVAVEFTEKANLGDGNFLVSPGGSAIVVYEADGTLRWSKLWPYRVWEVKAMRWVGSDLVVVANRLKLWDMDGISLDGTGYDAMYALIDGASGTVKAAQNATPQTGESVRLAAISASGRIVVLGDFKGTINLGGSDLVADSAKATNEFIASFDASFAHQWSATTQGDNGNSETRAVDIDDTGRVALGGSVEEVLELPGKTLSNPASSQSPYVALMEPAGTLGFAQVFQVAHSSNETDGVRFHSSGDVIAVMRTTGPIDLGAGSLDPVGTGSTGHNDLLLARLQSNGSVVWNRRLGTEGNEYNFRLAVEGDTLTVLGEFSDQDRDLDLGTGPVHTGGGFDVFLGQFSTKDGNTQWVRRFGCTEWDRPRAVSAVGDRACFTARFADTLDYGGATPLTSTKAFQPLVCIAP